MINKKVLFKSIDYVKSDFDYKPVSKEIVGTIIDKYIDTAPICNAIYPCEYYLIELEDGSTYSARPFEVIKIIKDDNLNQQP